MHECMHTNKVGMSEEVRRVVEACVYTDWASEEMQRYKAWLQSQLAE